MPLVITPSAIIHGVILVLDSALSGPNAHLELARVLTLNRGKSAFAMELRRSQLPLQCENGDKYLAILPSSVIGEAIRALKYTVAGNLAVHPLALYRVIRTRRSATKGEDGAVPH